MRFTLGYPRCDAPGLMFPSVTLLVARCSFPLMTRITCTLPVVGVVPCTALTAWLDVVRYCRGRTVALHLDTADRIAGEYLFSPRSVSLSVALLSG